MVLAGGAATRFPGKLDAMLGDATLLEHVLRGLRPLNAEVVLATEPAQGPFGALVALAPALGAEWLFAAPGDAPLLRAEFALRLWSARRDGDEAIVARTEAEPYVHPLPAFYARAALAREGPAVFAAGRRSLRALLARVRVREVEVSADDPALVNVNVPEDLERISQTREA